jgi:hypothetical protein
VNAARSRRLVAQAIETFELDLSGQTVLTEAASGTYSLTPLIAALAGADRVVALGRDSRYGAFADVARTLAGAADLWGVAGRLHITGNRSDELIGTADVVTNLGFVRPLDAGFLRRLKRGAAIPLMWETWEFRAADLDLSACRDLGIPVLGTDESHPSLQTPRFLGAVALKLLFELDVEVFRSRVVVLGSAIFASPIAEALRQAGAARVDVVQGDHAAMAEADALVIAEHESRDLVMGRGGWLDPQRLAQQNPAIAIAHICGHVDAAAMTDAGLRFIPPQPAAPGYMSFTTDYAGPRPLIDLHAAGLKVGSLLARARRDGIDAREAELKVLRECPFAQGFAGVHPCA